LPSLLCSISVGRPSCSGDKSMSCMVNLVVGWSSRRVSPKFGIARRFVVQPVNFLRLVYASFHEAPSQKPNEMHSQNFPIALSINIFKGFTASRCKIHNVHCTPYGFTGPAGYSPGGADGGWKRFIGPIAPISFIDFPASCSEKFWPLARHEEGDHNSRREHHRITPPLRREILGSC
jgi:hypothetical protein